MRFISPRFTLPGTLLAGILLAGILLAGILLVGCALSAASVYGLIHSLSKSQSSLNSQSSLRYSTACGSDLVASSVTVAKGASSLPLAVPYCDDERREKE